MNNSNFNSTVNLFLERFSDQTAKTSFDSLWNKFSETGINLWLDTGDIEAARTLWNNNFTALTTNNTLLNKEIQKGIYDETISDASGLFNDLNKEDKIKEIALLLNALHGSRLANIFNAKVSVELHTDLAHDIKGIEHYGTRLFNVNPDHFIIKVPFTAEGLIGARILHDKGIPVNLTLMFSARQNVLAALIAKPAYSNVFLGRIGAFLKDNSLGKPDFIGEKVTTETQKYLSKLRQKGRTNTKLIAASIRNWKQLLMLKNTDIFTIPVAVVSDAIKNLNNSDNIHFENPGSISLYKPSESISSQLEKLWSVNEDIYEIADKFSTHIPSSGNELIDYVKRKNCEDIFPVMNIDEKKMIMSDGKIPVYNHWKNKLSKNKTAIDSLLNLAGLYAFKKDQEALDERIAQKIA